MIRKKLTGAIDQYGFRKRRFTVQAMAEAIRLVASNCDNKWLVLTLLHVIRETCQKGKNNRQWRKVAKGVRQGSVLEPLLWNILYHDILRTNLKNKVGAIGNLALKFRAKDAAKFIVETNMA